jgi:hypothetical protein
LLDEIVELVEVELLVLEVQLVPAGPRAQDLRLTQRTAKSGDMRAERRSGARRRLGAVQILDQVLVRDHLTAMEEKDGEQRALAGNRRAPAVAPLLDDEWAEDFEFHGLPLVTRLQPDCNIRPRRSWRSIARCDRRQGGRS